MSSSAWGRIVGSLQELRRNRFLKLGIPFFVLVVGGSFGLEYFAKIRYQYRKQSTLTPEEMEKHGIKMKKPGEVTLESEFAKMEKMDIDTWENIRGPRPWEEPVPGAVKPASSAGQSKTIKKRENFLPSIINFGELVRIPPVAKMSTSKPTFLWVSARLASYLIL